jgi:ATP-dependent DNA ligase
MLHERLEPLAVPTMPLDVRPSRKSRYGSPLELSRVHWVRPELVAEVTYMTWTDDGLLRHTVFIGLREDKPATQVFAGTFSDYSEHSLAGWLYIRV